MCFVHSCDTYAKKKKKKWTGECTSVTQFGTVILMELNMKKKKKKRGNNNKSSLRARMTITINRKKKNTHAVYEHTHQLQLIPFSFLLQRRARGKVFRLKKKKHTLVKGPNEVI